MASSIVYCLRLRRVAYRSFFFFSSRRRHTRLVSDWSSDVCSSDLITSLGSPRETIEICKPLGIKVFCDVVDLKYAKVVEALGADAVIAVNNRAGGHEIGRASCRERV